MKEPRRWLDDSSPETLELRQLLTAAETPRSMNADERIRSAEQIEALENRSSLPVHRLVPDFSIVVQWLSDVWNIVRPVKRVKRRPRMFVLVMVAMLIQPFAVFAAPEVWQWWTVVVSREFAVRRAHKNTLTHWDSYSKIIQEKRLAPVNVVPEPSIVAPAPNAPLSNAPLVVTAPIVTKQLPFQRNVNTPQQEYIPDEPALPPAAGSVPSAMSSNSGLTGIKAELALIDEARALVGSNPSGALVLLGRHEREFPAGRASFTRELLYVEALQKSGRIGEARARAKGNLEWARGRSNEGKWQQVFDSLQ